jgi:hypothetical protein
LAEGPADELTYNRWWHENEMEEVFTDYDREFESEEAKAERERLEAQNALLGQLYDKQYFINGTADSAVMLSSEELADTLETVISLAGEADGLFRELELHADAEALTEGEGIISDINAAIQRVRDMIQAREDEFHNTVNGIVDQIRSLHGSVMEVNADDLHSDFIPELLDAI